MGLVSQTKSEFVADTLAKYGFGKRKSVQPVVSKIKHKFMSERPLLEESHERYADQGRANVLALLGKQEAG